MVYKCSRRYRTNKLQNPVVLIPLEVVLTLRVKDTVKKFLYNPREVPKFPGSMY